VIGPASKTAQPDSRLVASNSAGENTFMGQRMQVKSPRCKAQSWGVFGSNFQQLSARAWATQSLEQFSLPAPRLESHISRFWGAGGVNTGQDDLEAGKAR
jgi:hypothetical protein